MLSSISHELRTPLNSFNNSLNLIEFNQKELMKMIESKVTDCSKVKLQVSDQKFSKFLTMGKVSAKILENLVEDVLDLK